MLALGCSEIMSFQEVYFFEKRFARDHPITDPDTVTGVRLKAENRGRCHFHIIFDTEKATVFAEKQTFDIISYSFEIQKVRLF